MLPRRDPLRVSVNCLRSSRKHFGNLPGIISEIRNLIMNFKHIDYPYCRAIIGLARNPLYRNSLFMAFTSAFNAGCGFLFWMVAAWQYRVEQVGLATALISAIGLVILFSRLGLDNSIIRFLPLWDRGRIVITSLIVTTLSCIIAAVICILLAGIIAPSMLFLWEPSYALAFILIAVMFSLTSMTGSISVADRKADHYLLQNLFMAIRIPALVPLAFLGVFGILASVGLGYLAASLFGLSVQYRSVAGTKLQIDWEFVRSSFRFSYLNYISSILYMAPTFIIPLMVLNMLGAAEAARYYIAFALGSLVLIIPSSLGTSLFVEGSHGEELRKSVLRAGSATILLLVPAVLMLYLFGDRLLGLLNGEYMEAFSLLRIIALSCFLSACYFLFTPIQNVRMKVESIALLNTLRCALLLGLSYFLIPHYGILGAGYAWIATHGIIVLVIGCIARKEGWI